MHLQYLGLFFFQNVYFSFEKGYVIYSILLKYINIIYMPYTHHLEYTSFSYVSFETSYIWRTHGTHPTFGICVFWLCFLWNIIYTASSLIMCRHYSYIMYTVHLVYINMESNMDWKYILNHFLEAIYFILEPRRFVQYQGYFYALGYNIYIVLWYILMWSNHSR